MSTGRSGTQVIDYLQQWSKTYRDRGKYTPVSVTFHWGMAIVVTYQLFSGWTMQRYLAGPEKLEAYKLHSEIGLTLLLLGALRLVWRLIVPAPINDADAPRWAARVAHATHVAFYTLFIILPLSGWMMWSAIQPDQPLHFAGLFSVPGMPFESLSPEWRYWLLGATKDVHVGSVIILSLLVPIHVVAALKHHFWDRDDVLEGILPEVADTPRHRT